MNKRTWLLMAVAVSVPLVAAAVYAQEAKAPEVKARGAQCADGHKNKSGKMFEQLNLTAEQKQELQASRQAQRAQREATMSSLKEKRKILQDALKSPMVTRAGAQAIADEIKALQAKQGDLRLDGIFAAKEILTPEQFAKFQQIKEEKSGNMKKESGRHQRSDDKH
jgi:protein CpxP